MTLVKKLIQSRILDLDFMDFLSETGHLDALAKFSRGKFCQWFVGNVTCTFSTFPSSSLFDLPINSFHIPALCPEGRLFGPQMIPAKKGKSKRGNASLT